MGRSFPLLTVSTPRLRTAARSYGSEKSAPSGRASRAAVRSSWRASGVNLGSGRTAALGTVAPSMPANLV
jgi:hypothetical protein